MELLHPKTLVPGPSERPRSEKVEDLAERSPMGEHEIHNESHDSRRSPMIRLDEIHSLSHFQRNAKTFLRRLRKTRQPAVLTVNGRAQLVVQDAESYQRLLERIDRLEAAEGVRRGLESKRKGDGRPLDEVVEGVRRRLKLPPGPLSTRSS
jgi:PHD/YefM family antitoxin component YafN of YafNO toxin-antitoxin module